MEVNSKDDFSNDHVDLFMESDHFHGAPAHIDG